MLSSIEINSNRNISFGRAIRPDEVDELTQTSREAKGYLGMEKLALGIHRSSYPVGSGDLFIGSNMGTEAVKLNNFLKMFGFDTLQDGPAGLPSAKEPSPYETTVFSKSYINTDLKGLTTEPYGKLLAMPEILSKGSKRYEATSDMADFKRAFKAYDELFESAYNHLNKKMPQGTEKLKTEFEKFKKTSGNWLETDSLYEVLYKKSGNKHYAAWNDTAKNLITYVNDSTHQKHQEALQYLADLKLNNKKELDLYKFKQFIIDKQEREFIKNNPKKLDIMADAIIGFSPRDVWANQEVFLKEFRVGVPGGGAGLEGRARHQVWDIPVINPKTIFNEDGSLGKGGILLKQKFAHLLETYKNLRVDHVLGLIDPWIYNRNYVEIEKDAHGKVLSTNAHGDFLSNMNWDNSFDPRRNYSKILEEIILPLFKEKGIKIEDIAWESLGDSSNTFREVYFNRLHLPEINGLVWTKGENMPKANWEIVTCHDHKPFAQIVRKNLDPAKDFYQLNKGWAMNPEYLIGLLHPEKTNEERAKLINDLHWDTRLRNNSKFEELIRCAGKSQIFFADFFGLKKIYNRSGTDHPDNWKLRLSKNYQAKFYKNLEQKEWKGIALNMPGLFKRAIISKIYTTDQSRAEQDAEFSRMKPLIDKLEKYEKILYEPEQIMRNIGKAIKKVAQKGLKTVA
ncbi:MAG: 4-alpha-glucanotransferase [bacterium]